MSREEKSLTRYRAIFRGYPDALTPEQVRQMLGVGSRLACLITPEALEFGTGYYLIEVAVPQGC